MENIAHERRQKRGKRVLVSLLLLGMSVLLLMFSGMVNAGGGIG